MSTRSKSGASSRRRRSERLDICHVFPSELRIGDEIEGIYRERIPDHKNGGFKHHIDTERGAILLYGTKVLDEELSAAEEGDTVYIVYQGMAEKRSGERGKWYHLFRVMRVQEAPRQARRGR
jgi:hypothetical protein